MSAIQSVGDGSRVVVLALGAVPTIDATGLVALESALTQPRLARKVVVHRRAAARPAAGFEKANLEVAHDHVFFADTLEHGIELARDLVAHTPEDVRQSS
jgi:anti-anti-sigma regulatory factor